MFRVCKDMTRATFDEPEVNGKPSLRSSSPLLTSYPAPQGPAQLVSRLTLPDFSALTPGTHIPFTGVLFLSYVPDKRCIDLRTLRMHLTSFRDRQLMEPDAVQEIATTLIKHLEPWWLELVGQFAPREGIFITPTATYQRPQEPQA